jgi:hypothetical protein
MDSLGSHFEFLPPSSLHIGSDDWNRPVRGCMVVPKAGSSTVVTSTTAIEMKNIRDRQTDRQNVEDGYSNRKESELT